MKHLYTFTLLAAAMVFGLSSCSSSKSATQNSDDMYSSGNGKSSGSDYVAAAPNDQYVQMKAQDPDRWSYFDDYGAADSYYYPGPYGAGNSFIYSGFASPYYGLGYSPYFGPSYGFGLGFGDPYLLWNNYFIWNSWYNPYFYNPYYGPGAIYVGHSPTAVYSTLRPFGTTAYANGLAHVGVTGSSRNVLYRPGMTSTTVYNSQYANRASTGTYRPVNNSNNNHARGFSQPQPARSYSPSFGTGGGFRSGGFSGGGRH